MARVAAKREAGLQVAAGTKYEKMPSSQMA
jgi:hypothetical protein